MGGRLQVDGVHPGPATTIRARADRGFATTLKKWGLKKFLVVLSHSHNDHIAGNEVFKNAGADIIASKKTRENMLAVKDSVEGGYYRNVPDAPAINPVILPNILFDDNLEVYVGDIQVKFYATTFTLKTAT